MRHHYDYVLKQMEQKGFITKCVTTVTKGYADKLHFTAISWSLAFPHLQPFHVCSLAKVGTLGMGMGEHSHHISLEASCDLGKLLLVFTK